MSTDNAELLAFAVAMRDVPRPTWATVERARVHHLSKPLPSHLEHRYGPATWAEKCRKEHNRAVATLAKFKAKVLAVLRVHA